MAIEDRLADVRQRLQAYRRVVVAYSGGVDSTLVAKLACDVLGPAQVLAVTADSASLAREDLRDAVGIAQALGLHLRVVVTNEVADPAYRANTASRCYVCKGTLFRALAPIAREVGADAILYGAIGDDDPSERPGQRAAAEAHVRAPLQEAGLTKAEVRAGARALGLPNWDRPQNACLASRVPHGRAVTPAILGQIEAAEAVVRAAGFRQVRVRHVGDTARVEVEPEAVGRFAEAELRAAIVGRLRALRFGAVVIDPRGYRPGGADAELAHGAV